MPFEKRRPDMGKKKTKPAPSTTDSDTDTDSSPASAAATPNEPTHKWVKGKKRRASGTKPPPLTPSPTCATIPNNDTALPTHGSHKKGRGGGHNCPSKDAATTHPFLPRCIKQQHAGYCPSCNNLVSYKYGCHNHKWAKDRLSVRPLREEELIGPEGSPGDLQARWDTGRGRKGA